MPIDPRAQLGAGAEFLGLARQLSREVDTADEQYSIQINRLFSRIKQRLLHKHTLRREAAIDIQRAWRSVDHPFRIIHDSKAESGHLLIDDIVITKCVTQEKTWAPENWADALGICLVSLDTKKRTMNVATLATFSGHAIARWYERTGSTDRIRLLSDMAAIVLGPPNDGTVDVPGGRWLGEVVTANNGKGGADFRYRCVKTFLSSDQLRDWLPPTWPRATQTAEELLL